MTSLLLICFNKVYNEIEMKMFKKSYRFGLLSILSILCVGAFSFASRGKNVINVEAKIDINDYTACEEAYLDNDPSTLLSELRTITSPGQAGSYNSLWSTYKSAYTKDNGKIFDYYSLSTNYDPDKDHSRNYSKEGDMFNREHSIPQSWWGSGTTNQGADPFIVIPTDGFVNNARDSYPFGMVKNATKTFSYSKLGYPEQSTWGYSQLVFEPDDSVKGDLARIYFYSISKYSESYKWNQKEGTAVYTNDASTNFGLTNYAVRLFSLWSNLDPVSDWERHVNNAIAAIQGNRNPFIDHPEYADVLWGNVRGYTRYVVEGVQLSKTNITVRKGNTVSINATSENNSNISWSVGDDNVISIDKAVSESSENIVITALNGGSSLLTATVTIDDQEYSAVCNVAVTEETPVVHVESISLNRTSLNLKVGDTFTLVATILPEDSTNKNVRWSASNPGVANINPANGLVAAFGEGTCVITATSEDGGLTATCTVTVSNSSSSSGGCGGNIVTTSVLLSSISVIGVVMILFRRKKQQ